MNKGWEELEYHHFAKFQEQMVLSIDTYWKQADAMCLLCHYEVVIPQII